MYKRQNWEDYKDISKDPDPAVRRWLCLGNDKNTNRMPHTVILALATDVDESVRSACVNGLKMSSRLIKEMEWHRDGGCAVAMFECMPSDPLALARDQEVLSPLSH